MTFRPSKILMSVMDAHDSGSWLGYPCLSWFCCVGSLRPMADPDRIICAYGAIERRHISYPGGKTYQYRVVTMRTEPTKPTQATILRRVRLMSELLQSPGHDRCEVYLDMLDMASEWSYGDLYNAMGAKLLNHPTDPFADATLTSRCLRDLSASWPAGRHVFADARRVSHKAPSVEGPMETGMQSCLDAISKSPRLKRKYQQTTDKVEVCD